MSTNINNEKYNNLPALYANAGKLVNAEFSIKVDYTEVSTDTNKFTFVGTALKRASGTWQSTGLVVGDTITISFASAITPTGLRTYTRIVTYINGDLLYVDTPLPAPFTNLIFPTNGQVGGMIIKALKSPQSVEFQFNLTKSGVQSNDSLIDGELNRFVYNGAHLLAVNGIGYMTQLGNKSGGLFRGLAKITRLADTSASIFSYKNFKVEFSFMDWTIFNENNIYSAGSCVAPYITVKTYPLIGNPNGVQKDTNGAKEANTGYFNENYNGGLNSYPVITPISWYDLSNNPIDKMNYLGESKFSVTLSDSFGTSASRYRIGLAFKPLNEAFYKNKLQSMADNLMVIAPVDQFAPSTTPSSVVLAGNSNEFGVNFQISDLMFSQSSGAVTITGNVTPSSEAIDFFNDLADGERQMIMWVQIQNPTTANSTTSDEVNVLIYEDDCYPAPLIADQIPDVLSEVLLDHNGNDVDYMGLGIMETVTQDDCVYEIDILLEKDKIYDGVRTAISARVVVPEDSFELESIFISFENVPFINGIYEVNETISRNFNLPPSSNRNSVSVVRNPSEDTPTKYGISIRYSFLNDWRYWLKQNNVDNYFFDQNFPNNNKNKDWHHYQQEPWNLFVDTYLRVDGVDFYNHFKYFDATYEIGNVTLSAVLTNQNGDAITNLMANQINNLQVDFLWNDSTYNVGGYWAEFTIEDFESGNRFITSSIFERGNVANNPFVNNLLDLSLIGSQTVRAVAQIDTGLINASKVSITCRIFARGRYKENNSPIVLNYRKKQELILVKLPVNYSSENKGLNECCFEHKVFADASSNDSWKNDVKGAYIKLSSVSDTCTFIIEKCGVTLPNLGQIITFPNDPLAKGFVYEWKQYLLAHGIGDYTIKIQYSISGVTDTLVVGKYRLQQYNVQLLNYSIRIRSVFNSANLDENIDFTGSNYEDCIRTNGYFGLMEPNVEINNLIDKGRRNVKTSREYVKTYQLDCDFLNFEQSQLVLSHLLNEDGCYLTDCNVINHSYNYNDLPVILSGELEASYPQNDRLMMLKAKFNDLIQKTKSMYNV
jgi:hypothetical protein